MSPPRDCPDGHNNVLSFCGLVISCCGTLSESIICHLRSFLKKILVVPLQPSRGAVLLVPTGRHPWTP